jgi:nitrate/nitrite transporter NarK
MNSKQKKFKTVMMVIAIVGVLGTVIPNLLETSFSPAEKAVICLTYLIGIPLLCSVVYWVGKKVLRGR